MRNLLSELSFSNLERMLRALEKAGVDLSDLYWLSKGDNAEKLARFIQEERKRTEPNPSRKSVKTQLRILREQNEAWKSEGHPFIPNIDEVCVRLEKTAPEWPEGREAYRSLRIRFGEGREGVLQTFEAHVAAITRVLSTTQRWEQLHSDPEPYAGQLMERLRLANGHDNHQAIVEWIIINDLSANQGSEKTVRWLRTPTMLADEGLVFSWMFPGRVRAMDCNPNCPGIVFAGYEARFPDYDDDISWGYAPCVYVDGRSGYPAISAVSLDKAPTGAYCLPQTNESLAV